MVSAISFCLLAIGLTAVSSQLLPSEEESTEAPISDRRTFKHGKPVKLLPLVKKHKKFTTLVPHVFGKTKYTEVPIVHEAPKPLYKVHRYQGIEVKPLPDISFSTPEPFVESHPEESPIEYGSVFGSDHSFPSSIPSSSFLLYQSHDKPVLPPPTFSAPPPTIFHSLPPSPPSKPVFSFPPPSHSVIPSIPIISPPSVISIAPRPAPGPVFPQVPILPPPVFTSIPAPVPSNPPQPIFSSIPIKIQSPVLPPLPSPTPPPVFHSFPIKAPAPALPSIPVTPAPPAFSTVTISPPPLAHAFPSIPPPSLPPAHAPAPSPIPISPLPILPSPAPAISFIPSPPPALANIPIASPPEPEFPYPPSGVPIPSFIKDISLGNIEIKDTPLPALPTIEPPKFQDVTPTIIDHDSQNLNHGSVIKGDDGFLQKLKGWKVDKANAAFTHFSHFKPKPFVQFSLPPTPVYPTIQSTISQPLPLAQTSVFLPPSPQFYPPPKYENFPPNNIESPPLFNSYGVPIPHDSYSPHASHDRLSSAASEEEPSVVPAPKKEQKPEHQQRPSAQLLQEFQSQNFQPQSAQPVYVPQDGKSTNEEDKVNADAQPEANDYNAPQQQTPELSSPETQTYLNHKE